MAIQESKQPIEYRGNARFVLGVAIALAASALTFTAPPALAAGVLPAEYQAKLLARILPYDKTLVDRTKSMRVGVLFAPGNADSESAANALLAQLAKMGGKRIQGEPLESAKVPFGGKGDLEARHKQDPFAVLVMAPGLASQTGQIVQFSRSKGVLTVGMVRQSVKSGAVIALVEENDNPKIVVNMQAASAANASFSSAFLSLAETM